MPWFDYRAQTPGGNVITGRLEAESCDAAATALLGMRLEVRELHGVAEARAAAELSADDLSFFNEQLASMANAGIALDEGLAQLARDVESPHMRRWIDALVADLRAGKTLEQAVAAQESRLPLLYSRVVRAGVRAGNLSATLLNLNDHLRLVGRTRRIIWHALGYPMIVALLATIVVGAFLTFVVPRFAEILHDFDCTLPVLTRMVIGLGELFPKILLTLAILAIVVLATWRVLRATPRGRACREGLVSALPIIGGMHRNSLVARFTRGVSMAVGNSMPLPEALRLGAGVTGSEMLCADAEKIAAAVETGSPILEAAHDSRTIPRFFAYCVQSAAGRDALPTALANLASAYEQRAEHAQMTLRSILMPLIIVVLGAFLAMVILAIFLPLIALVSALTG